MREIRTRYLSQRHRATRTRRGHLRRVLRLPIAETADFRCRAAAAPCPSRKAIFRYPHMRARIDTDAAAILARVNLTHTAAAPVAALASSVEVPQPRARF